VDAFYFVVTTVTTVGYGDITPRDAPDAVKLYASLLMVLGSATLATLFSLITDALVTARFREAMGRQRVPEEGHVVVVGLGNVGYRIVEELRRAGETVVAIDRDPEAEFAEAVRGLGAVVTGDSRLPETLQKAGVPRARAVVAVTHDDAVNLGVALAARRLRPDVRTVVRLFDPDFARKVQEAFHVDAALSASLLAAPAFVAAALFPGVLAAFVEDGRFFVLLRGDAARLRSEGARPLLSRRPGESGFRPVPIGADVPGAEWVAVVSRPLD
jgi:voltage-gated potassium channel Kch